MTSTDVQGLLRFLTGPAKLPLRDAMGKAKPLLADGLSSPDVIAKSSLDKLQKIFPDEKIAKQVLSAAKRTANPSTASKKRAAAATTTTDPSTSASNAEESSISPSKRRRTNPSAPLIDSSNPKTWEIGLDLPTPSRNIDLISVASVTTNRAPLLLAFAFVSLGYTHPWLPLSSRFSLAQGLLELIASSKAKNLGITREGEGKEEELGEGHRRMRVLGKEIPVLRRWDVAVVDVTEPETGFQKQGLEDKQEKHQTDDEKTTEDTSINPGESTKTGGDKSVLVSVGNMSTAAPTSYDEPIFWALSTKLLAQPPTASKLNPSALPIQLPHAAHSYLVRAYSKEMLPLLLGALHLLYESWASSLDPAELDRRGWGWYCQVRPTVEDGPEGWGGRGLVKLKDILGMRKGGVK
ncbi:hypothetical protein ABW20_dc0107271 [Dactylellina cionopaga]|nr:hypothetical protein ABW20_dc0107271 [Dactylellina cionopaga]